MKKLMILAAMAFVIASCSAPTRLVNSASYKNISFQPVAAKITVGRRYKKMVTTPWGLFSRSISSAVYEVKASEAPPVMVFRS